ncbi:hypothetical protein [Georgenia subflava]|uniref:Uncharacterized protein n=1 Tax=Georgenia subflava TaxID=1622177 RepID=A0A6N7EMI4_9MICO|nr:hypothetical protein [Georgenia subflava]MPV38293.1 hypothetical protein [Georgenia subflava]
MVRTILDRGLAEPHHLLVLPDGIAADELEALAVSRSAEAGWVGQAVIQLSTGVHLTGPWDLDASLRAAFDLPPWSAQAYLLRCPVQRGGELPPELRGIDPMLDAFVEGVPVGAEQEALDHLRAFARRLGGALRLAGTGAVVVPDPEAAIDLTVFSPVWLDHDACLQVLTSALPHVRSLLDDIPEEIAREQVLEGYGIVAELGEDLVEISANGLPTPPTVLRGTDWAADGVVAYEVRWRPRHPESAFAVRPPLAVRRARTRAGELIEQAAVALHAVVGGEISDDDGFLVDPADLAS